MNSTAVVCPKSFYVDTFKKSWTYRFRPQLMESDTMSASRWTGEVQWSDVVKMNRIEKKIAAAREGAMMVELVSGVRAVTHYESDSSQCRVKGSARQRKSSGTTVFCARKLEERGLRERC